MLNNKSILYNNKIIFLKLEDFIQKIIKDKACFICGAPNHSKEFNDEHIIPNWILRKYKLQSRKITLPNETQLTYSRYKVPCCKDCNSELGSTYEVPMKELFSKPYEEIVLELTNKQEIAELLYKWLCLIYFKTHLKDTFLKMDQSNPKNEDTIGDIYFWEHFHHIHCIVRSHYTNAKLAPEVYGSLYINKIIRNDSDDPDKFDYIDNPYTKGILLQLENVCICSILDDSKATLSLYQNQLNDIHEGLNLYQFYEIFAHLNYLRINLNEETIFKSIFNTNMNYHIIAERPDTLELISEKDRIGSHGEFLAFYINRSINPSEKNNKFLKEIEECQRSFLWDDKGNFSPQCEHNART
ncbi:hypothetical protein I6H88_06325 [Elizabethkingia bruuniana]|uniref:HNH endonuclease n=2 Tax=Pseudomonadati TaxID=3379134 RepID=A0A7T7ZYT6_9FLAO|nr:hypothetical protein [Elizabethkingia bruuniana]AQX86172.1 hypothetical protein AYC65_14670 [Elizabethkingia bruuniana]KUY24684.1 hypothetical protein ATB97_09000 [Elizabethkingia bruuniana]OPB61737.1 hypothetical protein BAY12_11980 [Elizabethkingia bruuniana]QQN60191.1 hypothetical protein I6H88_06325 [Elizabethkingia bruuniana]